MFGFREASSFAIVGATAVLWTGAGIAAEVDSPEGGVLTTSSVRGAQKIFLDGRQVGVSPQTIRVPCGTHTLSVGRLKRQTVDIPCGGELILGKPHRRVPAVPDAEDAASGVEDAASGVEDAATAAPAAIVQNDGGTSSEIRSPETPPETPAAPASPAVSLGGRAFTYVRAPTGANPFDTPLQQASASVWLEVKPRLNEWSSAVASVSVDVVHSSIDPDTTLRARVREAFVDAYRAGFEIRAGQQIIPWGNADIYNPTDFLSARDYSFFAFDNEARRLAALDFWLSFTPAWGSSPFQFIVVWTPVMTGSVLLIPPALLALPPGVTTRDVVMPDTTLANSEVGARIVYKGNGWDAAIVGFRGFNHDSEFFVFSRDATSTVLARTYRAIVGAGLESSVSIGQWVFRLESAYVATETPTDPARQPSHVDAVLGVERPFLDRFRFQLQGILRHFPKHPETVGPVANPDADLFAIERGIAAANAILLNYQQQTIPGATLRLSFVTEGEKFEAEALGIFNFNVTDFERSNFLVRPVLTYHWTESLKFQAGAEVFGGKRDTPLGSLRSFSGAFVGGDYRF